MKTKFTTALSFALLILWMGLIFCFSHQNSELSSGQSGRLVTLLIKIFGDRLNYHITEAIIRKTAHFFIYFVLGVLAYNSIGRLNGISFWLVLLFCALYAASDEIHQAFVPGRAGRFSDIILDSCGSLLGMAIYKTLKKGSRKK